MTKSVIGGFQKIPKKNKYREDEWVKEKSKKKKPKRDKINFHNNDSSDRLEDSYEDEYELEEYN